MTSGTRIDPPRSGLRRLLGVDRRAWLLWASASSLTAHAQTFDLKSLMQRMAQRKSGEARFTEERTSAASTAR
jgi:hypothetical protein